MLDLRGYQVTKEIYHSSKTSVWTGTRLADDSLVVIKLPIEEYPSLQTVARFRHEYDTLKSIDAPSVVRAYSLERVDNRPALVLEDFGASSLDDHFRGEPVDVERFLELAPTISAALLAVQRNNIIHKDINPSNILVNAETDTLKFIDFGISTHLARETQEIKSPERLEGTLAYMSPEQTGRMNRALDYRSDYYSLGVTFYQLLSGSLPFITADPIELVHCHIAKEPVPLSERGEVPEALSNIVEKLMAKAAEDRYQSIPGLIADLERCREQLRAGRTIVAFPLAERDVSQRFEIPQRLYGRSREMASLLDAFSRVSTGVTELFLVAGYSGIGKSMLINEIHKPITRSKGYFISGKYDQYNRDIPYSAITQAFTGMLQQLLTEPEDRLAVWRRQILDVLGRNAQVIIDVIPALELLIGPQPPIADLEPTEAQNRFNLVFQEFLGVIANQEHPVAIFVDDLQWADPPSLALIHTLITDVDSKYLLMIGAYRDNEVDDSHRAAITFGEIKKSGATVETIQLGPLTLDDISELVADTLHSSRSAVSVLAKLLEAKTGGNPFFLVQLLHSLEQDGLIQCETDSGRWRWDIDKIQAIGITDNVLDLMAAKIQRLPDAAKEALQTAACIGNKFDLNILSITCEKPYQETATALWPALLDGLILPLSSVYNLIHTHQVDASAAASSAQARQLVDEKIAHEAAAGNLRLDYKFSHDRIQQATYSLIPESRRQAKHLEIGRLLLNNTAQDQLADDLFDIVRHFNVAQDRLDDPAERTLVAELNARCAKKAKSAAAYGAAADHCAAATRLLGDRCWEEHYQLTMDMYRERAECEYVLGNFESSDEVTAVALANAKTSIDKAHAYYTLVMRYCTASDYDQALGYGRNALELLGHPLPVEPEEVSRFLAADHAWIARSLEGREIGDLVDLPPMEDPESLMVMKLLMCTFFACFYSGRTALVMATISQMIRTSLEHGNTELASYGYVSHAMFLTAGKEYKDAYAWGNLAKRVNQLYPQPSIKTKVLNVYAHTVNPYFNSIHTNPPIYREVIETALESGDMMFGIWAVVFLVYVRLHKGDPIQEVYEESQKLLSFALKTKDTNMLLVFQFQRRLIQYLQGHAPSSESDDPDDPGLEDDVRRCREAGFPPGLNWTATMMMQMHYLFGEYDKAAEYAAAAVEHRAAVAGFFIQTALAFYRALTFIAMYPRASQQEREEYDEIINSEVDEVRVWSELCPENYLHRYLLLQAEQARLRGDETEAGKLYDESIENARSSAHLHDEALANELAGKYYLERGRRRLAQIYITDAYYAYTMWGASRKVIELERQYSELLVSGSRGARTAGSITWSDTTTGTLGASSHILDLAAVIKASHSVSSEIVLRKLLENLMDILLENAGAQTGHLLLYEDGALVVEASATTTSGMRSVLQSEPLDAVDDISQGVVRYVERTLENVVLADASQHGKFTSDPYMMKARPKSVLCVPVVKQRELIGVMYLENNLMVGAFTPSRIELLQILAAQAAISIENSRLYGNLEGLVKERTQELRQTQERLLRLERRATEKRMAGGFAHEVRNALGGSKLVIDRALGEGVDASVPHRNKRTLSELGAELEKRLPAEEFRELMPMITAMGESEDLMEKVLRIVERSTTRALRIASRILEYSQVEDEERGRTMVDVSALMARLTGDRQEGLDEHGIRLVVDVEPSLKVWGIEAQVQTVLSNLVSNARDAIVSAERETPGVIEVQAGLEGPECVIRVHDDGVGIPERDLGQIFDAFFSTRPAAGSGLGLAVVKEIVEANGGRVAVKSKEGVGSEFTVVLPAVNR